MQNSTTFYIVRHGETVWNREHRMQGQEDSPLTREGEQAISELGGVLKDIHFDYVFSSDLLRAKRTAELLTIERKLAVNTTHLLRERSFGKYEGRLSKEYLEENKKLLEEQERLSYEERVKFKLADDIESDDEVIQRVLLFIREAAVTYVGKTLLLVAHGGTIRVLLAHLGYGIGPGKGKVKNGGYVRFVSDGVEFEVEQIENIELITPFRNT